MEREKILVTGATGFIGRALVRELVRRGYPTRCAVRNRSSGVDRRIPSVEVGNIDGSSDWTVALAGVDTVIHLAGRAHVLKESAADPESAFREVNLEGTAVLANAAADQGVRRLVYVSSVGVNGDQTTGQTSFNEEQAPAPHNAYAASKYAAEQAIAEIAGKTGLEFVILRPPLVYGPENPGNFLRLLTLVERRIPLPLGSIDNRRSMVYIANLVDALITVAVRPQAAGKLYLVSDRESVSTPDLITELGRLLGVKVRLVPFPVLGLHLAGKVLRRSEDIRRLTGSLVVDSSRMCRELDWSQPITLQQGLEQTVRWYRGPRGEG